MPGVDGLSVACDAPALVVVPPRRYLMVDGRGDPARSPAFGAAVLALHAAAGGGAPLEALWWVEDEDVLYLDAPRDAWRWTLLVAQAGRARVPAPLRRETLDEGLAVQVLHTDPPAVDRLHEFVFDNGYRIRGRHHEIFRRDGPSILRVPIE
jgi:hypothetical protein